MQKTFIPDQQMPRKLRRRVSVGCLALVLVWVLVGMLSPAAGALPVIASNISESDFDSAPSVAAGRALPRPMKPANIDSVVLRVDKVARPDPDGVRRVGDTVIFDITIKNDGTTAIILLPASDTYDPTALQYQSAVPAPNSVTPLGTLTWNDLAAGLGGQLAAGASTTITVNFTALKPGTTTNRVDINGAVDEFGTSVPPVFSSAPVTIMEAPQIVVTKTANPTSVPETGGTVVFTVLVENPSTTQSVTINTITDDRFGTLAGDADCQVGTVLAIGGSCSFQFTRTVSGDFPGSHTNVVTVTGTGQFGDPVSDTDDAVVTFTDVLPDITVTKTANPTSVSETGGNVTFTYVVTNNSLEAATLTVLSDDKFGTLAGDADCQVGTVLPGGGSCTFSATFAVPAGDYPGSHVNVFTATASDGDGNTDTATDDAVVTFTDVLPDITVTKTANPTSVPETGGNVTFTYVVTNNSLEAATLTVLSDDKFGTLAGDADCQVGTVLPGGGSCTFSATFAVPAGDYPGSHVNVFTATASDGDGNTDTATDDAVVTYTDVLPDITVTKTANPTSVPETGGNVTFTYVVTNNSLEAATLTVLSDDKFGTLAGDADCQVGTVLPGGGSCTFSATFAVPAGDYPGSHVNVFTATASDGDGNTDTATDDATVIYTDVLPDITVTKTADPTFVPETGGNVTFTYVVTNNSLEAATLTVLSDNKFGTLAGDADCQVGTVLPGGASCTFSATFAVPAGDYPGSHVNVFTATASDGDGNTDTATDDATVIYTDVLPDITVTKTADPTFVPETGGNVTFTYVVTNNSLEAATLTVLSDNKFGTLAGDADCQVGTVLPGGASCTFSATFAVPAGDYPGSHVNVFTATASDGDGNTDTATDDATVIYTNVTPVITLTKTANPITVVEPGGAVVFTVRIDNTSIVDAVTINSLMDNIHGNLAGQGTCAVPQTIPAGGFYQCTFTANVNGVAGYTETDTVTATGTGEDGEPLTAQDSATVTVVSAGSSIAVTKTANPTTLPEPGGSAAFTVRVDNTSPVSVINLTSLVDDIYGNLNGLGTCAVPQNIPAGSFYQCTFNGAVTGNPGTTHTDTVVATGTDNAGKTVTGSDTATVTITNVPPSILVTKTADPTEIEAPGGPIAFTVRIENTSLTDVVTINSLIDDIHGDVTLIAGSTCTVPQTLPVGASYQCTFTAVVTSRIVGHIETDTVTATGVSDDNESVSGSDTATVTFTRPTAVDVQYFTASWTANGAKLTWAALLDVPAEFRIYRSFDPKQHGKRISTNAISPEAPAGPSSAYTWVDADVEPGGVVYYWLEVYDGASAWLGPVTPTWAARLRLPFITR